MISYQQLLSDVLTYGESHSDRTGVGTTSLFGYQWRHSLAAGFPLLTTKRVAFRWVAVELMWFLQGRTDNDWLKDRGVDIWDEWSTVSQTFRFGRSEGDLGPIYGGLWNRYPVGRSEDDLYFITGRPREVNQLDELIQDIIREPNSRRLIVTGWHPYYAKRVALPPCHTMFQLKCHGDGSISLHLYARSIDAFLGLPFNIASYGLLLSVIGVVVNRVPRELIISFGDLHIYNNHKEQAELQISREPYPLPQLRLEVESLRDWKADIIDYKHHPRIDASVAI
jgi:thymidylate synthase